MDDDPIVVTSIMEQMVRDEWTRNGKPPMTGHSDDLPTICAAYGKIFIEMKEDEKSDKHFLFFALMMKMTLDSWAKKTEVKLSDFLTSPEEIANA